DSDSDPAVARRPVSPRRHGSREKIVAPASRRHLRLDNSFWVNTTFAGWKPAIHFFSRPQRTRRFTEEPKNLRTNRAENPSQPGKLFGQNGKWQMANER